MASQSPKISRPAVGCPVCTSAIHVSICRHRVHHTQLRLLLPNYPRIGWKTAMGADLGSLGCFGRSVAVGAERPRTVIGVGGCQIGLVGVQFKDRRMKATLERKLFRHHSQCARFLFPCCSHVVCLPRSKTRKARLTLAVPTSM